MTRKTTPSFIHTFELQHAGSGMGSFHDIEIAADFYRKIYNAVLGALYTNARHMKDSQEWQYARHLPRKSKDDLSRRAKAFEDLKRKYKLSKSDAEKFAKNIVKTSADFSLWTNSAIVQAVAERARRAVDRWILAKAKRLRFKSKKAEFSFEGKSNKTGVRIVDCNQRFVCLLGKRQYSLVYDINDAYAVHALSSRCKYARIVFKTMRGKRRFFVQGVFEGQPFEDQDKKQRHVDRLLEREGADYFERKSELPPTFKDKVAYDMGPKNIAIATPLTSLERPLCEGVDTKHQEIKRLQRALERSRRKSNPQNYDESGRVKTGVRSWLFSKSYIKKRTQYAELERRKSAERKSNHGKVFFPSEWDDIFCLQQ